MSITRNVILSPLVLLCVGPLAAPLHAGETQALQELFQSDVVFPQNSGETQITLAPQYAAGRGFTREEGDISLEYGLTDAWQIGAEWTSYVHDAPSVGPAAHGIGDLDVSTKYSWMNIAGSRLHAALGVAGVIPTAKSSNGLGDGQFALISSAVLATDIPRFPGAQAFINIAGEINDGAAQNGRHFLALNFGAFAPIGQITLTSEWNFSNANGTFYTPGIVWRSPYSFEFGIGVPIGLSPETDKYRVLLTLVREFE